MNGMKTFLPCTKGHVSMFNFTIAFFTQVFILLVVVVVALVVVAAVHNVYTFATCVDCLVCADASLTVVQT